MKRGMQARLSAMMFLEYFVWGSWYVTFGTFLSNALHFSGREIGVAAGATAVGAMIAPFFVGLVADRYFATQKVLSVLHLIGGAVLFLASRQTTFAAVYVPVLLYCLCFMPTLALTNSLAFRQMTEPKEEFGPIRVLGTVGWIVAGLLVGSFGVESTAWPMRLGAMASLIMAVYCLTLPATPPLAPVREARRKRSWSRGGSAFSGRSLSPDRSSLPGRILFPREVAEMLRERPVAIFALTSVLICVPLQFYYAFTNLFLNETGMSHAAGKMTGGQMSELACMLLLPWFFRRLGVKSMLIAAMVAWTGRYVLFAFGDAGERMWMLWAGILLHGICYDFFFVTGQIYIDRRSPLEMRAAAQGLMTFLTYGVGMFVGSWVSGGVVERFVRAGHTVSGAHAWRSIWLIAAGASAAVLLLFLSAFRDGDDVVEVSLAGPQQLALEASS